MKEKNKKYPEGYFVGMWIGISIAIFTGAWLPICIALKNPGLMGIGPAFGMALGVAIGQSIEEKYKRQGKIKPLTKEEKKNQEGCSYYWNDDSIFRPRNFSCSIFIKIK